MFTLSDILGALYSLMLFLAVIPALWVAGYIVLRNISIFRSLEIALFANRAFILIVWLAIGGLFIVPLIDLIGLIYSFTDAILLSLSTPARQIKTIWGESPWQLFVGMKGLLTLAVYGSVLWVSRKVSSSWRTFTPESIRLTSIEKGFITLAIGGLVNQFVKIVIINVVATPASMLPIQLSAGLVGFILSWLLGLFLLGLILVILNNQLESFKPPQ